MCYSGCKYENRLGECKKPFDKVCPDTDYPVCGTIEGSRCEFNRDGYCTSEESCRIKEDA